MAATDKPLLALGPCTITFDSVDLGNSEGGVQVRDETVQKDIKTDQAGETPVDTVEMGRTVEVTVPMTQPTYTQLEKVVAGATGVHNSTGDKTSVKNVPGTFGFAAAKVLILKAIKDGAASAEKDDWITFPKAYPQLRASFTFGKDGQRIFNVVFKVFPDATTREMYVIGDQAAA